MSWKYRERYFESGDILDPRDWNLNWESYVAEMNGLMDRDNVLADSIGTAQLANTTLDYAEASLSTSADATLSLTSTAWQMIPDMAVSLTTTSDEAVCCEISVQVTFTRLPGTSSTREDAHLYYIRMTMGGSVVAESGPLCVVHIQNCVYLCGTAFLTSGANALRGEIRFTYDDDTAAQSNAWATVAGVTVNNRIISGWRRRR